MGKRIPKIYPIDNIDGDTDVNYDVLIDTREQLGRNDEDRKFTDELMKYFDQMGITYRRIHLPVGDYIINRGNGVVVEMKSVPDLVASITGKDEVGGKRLMLQLKKFSDPNILPESFIKVFLVRGALNMRLTTDVTIRNLDNGKIKREHKYTFKHGKIGSKGTLEWNSVRIHPNTFIGIINSIENVAKFIPTGDWPHTFDWFRVQIDRMRDYEKKVFNEERGEDTIKRQSIRSVKSTMSDVDKIHSVLEGFVKVGPVYTARAMKKYGTLRNLFKNATEESLVNECGWNRPTAKEFIRILNAQYDR